MEHEREQAQRGDEVVIHYVGKLEDGRVFDSSKEKGEPLNFTLGKKQVIPGLEEAIHGMAPGESKSTTIAPDQAYGDHQEERVVEIDRSEIPDEMDPEVGQPLHLRLPDGQSIPATVTALSEDTITADANHPLDGHTLKFDIELIEISGNGEDGSSEESNIITP